MVPSFFWHGCGRISGRGCHRRTEEPELVTVIGLCAHAPRRAHGRIGDGLYRGVRSPQRCRSYLLQGHRCSAAGTRCRLFAQRGECAVLIVVDDAIAIAIAQDVSTGAVGAAHAVAASRPTPEGVAARSETAVGRLIVASLVYGPPLQTTVLPLRICHVVCPPLPSVPTCNLRVKRAVATAWAALRHGAFHDAGLVNAVQ